MVTATYFPEGESRRFSKERRRTGIPRRAGHFSAKNLQCALPERPVRRRKYRIQAKVPPFPAGRKWCLSPTKWCAKWWQLPIFLRPVFSSIAPGDENW
jgi:hypothetical protein